jgi:hypothetical protein
MGGMAADFVIECMASRDRSMSTYPLHEVNGGFTHRSMGLGDIMPFWDKVAADMAY